MSKSWELCWLPDHLGRQVLGGVAASSVGDAVDQARMLIDRDCRGVLLAPPFYFKNVTDEGLYRWFSQVCEKIGKRAHDVFLYHIPSVTQVALSIELIGRLKGAFPAVVAGVKDSGGDWAYTDQLLKAHADLTLLIGDERHLSAGLRRGAQGAISGLANVCPELLLRLIEGDGEDTPIVELVNQILKFPVTPAVKALVAESQSDPAWLNVRPPLMVLTVTEAARVADAYRRIISEEVRYGTTKCPREGKAK